VPFPTAEAFTAQPSAAPHQSPQIDFAAFLSLLCKLSVKAFRREARSSSEAFEMMLHTKVLPLASRRFPEDVAGFMADPQVAALFADNQDEIKRAFDHHAPHGSLAYAGAPGLKGRPCLALLPNPGDPLSAQGTRTLHLCTLFPSADFLRLAGASDLTPALLTAAELGDAFLSSTASVCALGALSYAEFLQALVRCALMAYSKVSDSTILHKLSSLLLHMRDARARRRL
jgi:hypothetical protein